MRSLAFSWEEQTVNNGGSVRPDGKLQRLHLAVGTSRFELPIEEAGAYAVFTQHHPEEFKAVLRNRAGNLSPLHTHQYKPDHGTPTRKSRR